MVLLYSRTVPWVVVCDLYSVTLAVVFDLKKRCTFFAWTSLFSDVPLLLTHDAQKKSVRSVVLPLRNLAGLLRWWVSLFFAYDLRGQAKKILSRYLLLEIYDPPREAKRSLV